MATVYIPSLLRDLTGGRDTVNAAGRTVRQIIEDLEARFPGIRQRLCDGESLRPGIAVAVDGELATRGLLQSVDHQSEVHFLPAISGG